MKTANARAFKEWAIVCRALAEGRQILILRKGGIAEFGGVFELTDEEFFLFPTYLHQAPESVIPDWREALQTTVDPSPGRVSIAHYATVAAWERIESLEKLRALRGSHIWSDAIVEERFHRWHDHSVFALIVRIFALPRPVELERLESYAGCTSWITLAREIPLAGATPVLPDAEFESRVRELQALVR